MNGLIEITNDLFDIAARLKSINPNYVVYYNSILERFEVHEHTKYTKLAFVVPYDELDARTVDYAYFTRVQNAKNLFKEIEEHNKRVEEEHDKQQYKKIEKIAEAL